MKQLRDTSEAWQQLVRETAGQLRAQLALLTEQLGTAEHALECTDFTRATTLELTAEVDTKPPEATAAWLR
ncbi:hypothetical protein ACFC0M_00695 [Streptomyces sp. NPDC056149]|uniref:hypothetical protein n=1 Tax=unclassified Streptomyces TaxID=2593676 RepID=UPI002381788D|nr:hypothetical protein [Streptomyces sp. WZ-12]